VTGALKADAVKPPTGLDVWATRLHRNRIPKMVAVQQASQTESQISK